MWFLVLVVDCMQIVLSGVDKRDAMVAAAVVLLVEPSLSVTAVRCGSWNYNGRIYCITFLHCMQSDGAW